MPPPQAGVVALSLQNPATGAEVVVADLPEPIALTFDAAPAHQPSGDWYRCVYLVDGGTWAGGGVWVDAAAPTLQCLTTHLSAFTVEPIVNVAGALGCAAEAAPTALHCDASTGGTTLTITGGNFGAQGATVTLEAATVIPNAPTRQWGCGRVYHVVGAEDSALVCAALHPIGDPGPHGLVWADVTVRTQAGHTGVGPRLALLTGPPVVYSLHPLPGAAPAGGCVSVGPRALAQCPPAGAAFAIAGAGLVGYGTPAVTAGLTACPTVVAVNTSWIECYGLVGEGRDHQLRVTVNGVPSTPSPAFTLTFADPCAAKPGQWAAPACVDCQPAWYGPACLYRCPGTGILDPVLLQDAFLECAGHGLCDDGLAGTGTCRCHSDDVLGHWDGATCTECQPAFFGPQCTHRCPTAAPLPWPCAGHGVCDAGLNGTGACVCILGHTGPACALSCPTHASQLCAGHGRCVAAGPAEAGVCACDADPAVGYWQGTVCTQCRANMTGPSCAHPCPGQGPAHAAPAVPVPALDAGREGEPGSIRPRPPPRHPRARGRGRGRAAVGGGQAPPVPQNLL